MKKAAMTWAFAMFVGAPTAFAQDKPEAELPRQDAAVDTGAMPAAIESPKADASSTGEIGLENAAVDRAFAGGAIVPTQVRVRPHRFGVYLGFRATNVKDPGYDPYSESDALVQNAIGVSFSPWRTRPWSLHFLAEWNFGATSAYARGAQTDLFVNRLALGLEGRWMPNSRFYLYAKAVPALVHLGGEIDDFELGVKLESSVWTFGLDTSAGAALRLGTAGDEPKRTASFWLMMDWGYSFAGQASMVFRPANIDDETRTFGAVNLPGLRPGGFVTRMSFAVTF